MNRISRRLGLLMIAGMMSAGCTRTVYITEDPPPPQVEEKPASPGASHVWVDGHWKWNGNRYVWVSGHWDKPGKGVWVAGHWDKTRRGWRWVPGHWRR